MVSKAVILLSPGGASGEDEARGDTPPRTGRSQPQECDVEVVVVVGLVRTVQDRGGEAMVKAIMPSHQQAVMEISAPVSKARIFVKSWQ